MRPLRKYTILPALVLLASCGSNDRYGARQAEGGKRYGGVFNANETEQIRSIFPLSLSQASAHRIAAQIYQGLVRLDPGDLSIRPCLAASWEVDPNATTFTFHLRKDVLFHADPVFKSEDERVVDADAVIYCLTRICTASPDNQMFWLFQDQVEGANAYYKATAQGEVPKQGVTGFEAIDPFTVRIHLLHAAPDLLEALAHQGCWIYPRQLVETYGQDLMHHAIGTGPFRLKVFAPGEAFVLERDPDHWDRDEFGNRLPFLDAIRYTLEPDKNKELDNFLKGKITCVFEIPIDRTSVLADSLDPVTGQQRYLVRSVPALSVQFYGFNANRRPFDDVRVRRAFAMAIDKKVLVDSVLKHLAVAADHGLVAPGLVGYPYEEVPGIPFDPDSARLLIRQAGYGPDRPLPPVLLQVNNDGYGYVRVAEAVQAMLEGILGVAIGVSVLPADQHFDRIETGRADLWREGWLADHPDPANFLALLYGKNAVLDTNERTFLNTTRYHNMRFDSLFVSAQRTVDRSERMRSLAGAEAVAMQDVPLVPLYHERSIRLMQPYVRDLPMNAMEYRDLGRVWFDREGR